MAYSAYPKGHKFKAARTLILTAIFVSAFIYAQSAMACEQIPQPGAYQNISVQVAHRMIGRDNQNPILLLDVRYLCEYHLGHLYGAVLMPYDQLQSNISEFQAYKNQTVIVYCKSGARSEIACEILANNGFRLVYNMVGGIFAWINAGYEIYTTYHYAWVDLAKGDKCVQIDPLLLYQTGPPPCSQGRTYTQNATCAACYSYGNQTVTIGNDTATINATLLEQDASHTLVLLTFEVNGTTFEFIIARTLLWTYNELTDGINRTARLVSTEISSADASGQFYSLSYMVQQAEYNLTLYTNLGPLNSEIYNRSFTIMNYAPAGKSEVTSLEFVEFNSSVTLSQQYAILGKVAKEIGEVYKKSGDETLAQLAKSYYTMEEEARHLSKLVEKQLAQYNLQILQSAAIMMDQCTPACVVYHLTTCYGYMPPLSMACVIGCLWGSFACGPFWALCLEPCVMVCGAIDVGFLLGCLVAAALICCFGL